MISSSPPLSISQPPKTTVALADPRWTGHHPTFFAEFASSLVRLGVRVIALNAKPGEFKPVAGKIAAESGLAFNEAFGLGHLDDPGHAFLLKNRDHDPISAMQRWRCLRHSLKTAERESGWHADMVFFPWLDSYLRFAPSVGFPSRYLKRPWSGLYFRTVHLGNQSTGMISNLKRLGKGDRALRNEFCSSVAVLDERFNSALHELTGKPVIQFPDVTDETPPSRPTELSAEILKRANGRPIIGLVSMEKRKGVLTLLKTALRSPGRDNWFFMFAGPYARDTFTVREHAWIQQIADEVAAGKHHHIHLRLDTERVRDGVPFNALIDATDVVYAAYEGFQGSSNALTKAAIFEKPVIATRGECVGMRVDKFRLGLCIDEGNTSECKYAINNVLAGKDWDGNPLVSQFEEYRRIHSRATLDEAFHRILDDSLPDWSRLPSLKAQERASACV